jgi:hypothetical protein
MMGLGARIVVACGLLLSVLSAPDASASAADEPKTPGDYVSELQRCSPSCYNPGTLTPSWATPQLPTRKICAYKDFPIEQTSAGPAKTRWGSVEAPGVPLADPTELSPCKLPPSTKGKWAPILQAAKRHFSLSPGDTMVIPSGDDWSYGIALDDAGYKHWSRRVHVRIYSKDYEVDANRCNSYSSKDVCEESGSKAATELNSARYRLDEAKGLRQTKKLAQCRTSAFDAMASARGLTRFKQSKGQDWATGLKYRTAKDGDLTEDQLFAKMAAFEKEALEIFKACGGTAIDTTEMEKHTYGLK